MGKVFDVSHHVEKFRKIFLKFFIVFSKILHVFSKKQTKLKTKNLHTQHEKCEQKTENIQPISELWHKENIFPERQT